MEKDEDLEDEPERQLALPPLQEEERQKPVQAGQGERAPDQTSFNIYVCRSVGLSVCLSVLQKLQKKYKTLQI